MKQDERGFVIDFRKKVIPKNVGGDPDFKSLYGGVESWVSDGYPVGSILQQFSPAEVTLMVNRYLYQVEYQSNIHRNRAREEAALLKPVKEKVRELFGISYTEASLEQIKTAVEVLKEG